MNPLRHKHLFKAVLAVMFGFGFANANAQEQCPGITVVGCGYDVFGFYANNKSVKEPLFRLENYSAKPMDDGQQYDIPDIVRLRYINEKDYKIIEGSSLKEYATQLKVSAGVEVDAKLFSAGIETSFGKDKSSKASNHFITITDWTRIWEVFINPAKTNLRNYLSDDAKNAIDTWNITRLFEVYGTHYVSNGYFGGAMDFSLSEAASSQEEANSISVSVKAKYKVVSANSSVEVNNSQKSEDMMNDVKIYTRGGDVQYANKSVNGDNDQYNLWVQSIPTKAVLIDFKKGSLVGIWTLASTTQRKNEIQAAFKKLAAKYPMPEGNAANMVSSSQINYISSVNDQGFWDFSGYHFNAQTVGGYLQTYDKDVDNEGLQGADRFFSFIPHPTKPEYVFIQPQHCQNVLQIENNSKTAGAKVLLAVKSNNNNAQLFQLVEGEEGGMVYLKNVNSGLFLTTNGKGNKITQEADLRASNNTSTTTPKTVAKTTAGIGKSKVNPNMKLKTKQTSSASTLDAETRQQWMVTSASPADMAPPSLGKYHIKNLAGGLYFDLTAEGQNPSANDTPVQIWNMDGGPDRTILINSVPNQPNRFFLQPLSGILRFEILSRSKEEGAKLIVCGQHGATSQQFEFEYAGQASTYYIKNVNSGKYIQVDESLISSNGSPVIQKSAKGDNAKWVFEKIEAGDYYVPTEGQNFYIKCAYTNKYIDRSDSKGVIQLWDLDNGSDRIFTVKSANDGNRVTLQSGYQSQFIDIPGNNQSNGTLIQLYEGNSSDAQKFMIYPIAPDVCIIYTTNGKVLDVYGGKTNNNGTRICVFDASFSHNQKFQLIHADGPNKGKTFKFF